MLLPFMQLHLSLQLAHSQMCTEMSDVIILYHQVAQSLFPEHFFTCPFNHPHGCLKFSYLLKTHIYSQKSVTTRSVRRKVSAYAQRQEVKLVFAFPACH